MIPCRTANRLVSEGMDRPLGLGDRARLRLHLAMCVMCSRVERQMDFLRQAMRHIGDG
ncbi:MAG: zf-HC2 domain-containing protein [Burkholderiales bacterium]|nr:zf-HC2 domain-containing protein [Burkholderiales bacterium]